MRSGQGYFKMGLSARRAASWEAGIWKGLSFPPSNLRLALGRPQSRTHLPLSPSGAWLGKWEDLEAPRAGTVRRTR